MMTILQSLQISGKSASLSANLATRMAPCTRLGLQDVDGVTTNAIDTDTFKMHHLFVN